MITVMKKAVCTGCGDGNMALTDIQWQPKEPQVLQASGAALSSQHRKKLQFQHVLGKRRQRRHVSDSPMTAQVGAVWQTVSLSTTALRQEHLAGLGMSCPPRPLLPVKDVGCLL